MRIFRVETAEGVGAYRAVPVGHPDEPAHKLPSEDAYIGGIWSELWMANRHHDYFFGFVSLSSLMAWFHDPAWLSYAHENGLAIHVYEVDEHAQDLSVSKYRRAYPGTLQAIFRRDSAKHIYSIPLQQSCAA